MTAGDVESTVSNWVRGPYLLGTDKAAVRKRLYDLMEHYAEQRFLRLDPDLAVYSESAALARLEALDTPTLIVVSEEDVPDEHGHDDTSSSERS